MHQLVHIIGWTLCGCGVAGAGYALASMFAAARFFRQPAAAAVMPVPVTLLKPLYRDEPGLVENLESFCNQEYGAPIQLVLGLNSGDDAARAVAQQVIANHPQFDITTVEGDTRQGSNPKIGNLLNMLPAAKHDFLVISDSDIGVSRNYLSVVAAALQTRGTGAVTCCYAGAAAVPGVWAQLSAMGINQHFLPDTLFALDHRLASPCFGSTIAITRKTLAEIGGLLPFASLLADDYEIGRAVRSRGYSIAVPPMTVRHSCSESSFSELMHHELRWARTIRLVNPLGFVGTVFTHAIPLSLLAVFLPGFAPLALAVLGVATVSRLWLANRINSWVGVRDPIWLVPVRDLLSFVIYLGALFARRVEWRGARFHVSSAGAMAQE
jgi:ceramide glucosyltransferase